VDRDESVKQAMVREAKEEAGIIIDVIHLEVVHVMYRKSKELWVNFFLRASQWDGKPSNLEPHKCDYLGWFEVNELPENIIPYIRAALKNIREGVGYSEFGWED
jgi:ADP-ribose pyrophosphatase YjhB (NUDIX family)